MSYYPKPETKQFSAGIGHNTVQNSTQLLTNIQAGAGPQDRVGRKIRVKSAEIALRANPGSGAIRAVLYVPKTSTETLTLTSVAANADNDAFWIVKDWILNPQSNNIGHGQWIRHRFPMTMLTEYDGSAAGDTVKNNLKLLLFAANSTTITGHTKVWFNDN